MKFILLLSIYIFLTNNSIAENNCESGWLAYENEKCVKLFADVETYSTAVKICANHSQSTTLVSVLSRNEQQFIENYVFNQSNSVDSVWLGGSRIGSNALFHWEDGSQLSYTNWDTTDLTIAGNNCVEMQDQYGFQAQSKLGKWFPVSCDKRNIVLCQYPQNWTLTRLQYALIDLKYKYQSLKEELTEVEDKASSSGFPIGFIYSQLPNQSEPKTIWPNTDWQDISGEYAGLFFRVVGGESREFGAVQSENSPHLRDVNYEKTTNQPLTTQSPQFTTPSYSNTTTKLISYCSYSCNSQYNNFLFEFVSGAVTPRNQAMRVWKRIK